MNKMQRKLRSKDGATIILALVFLMFCMFLGGSVLAAAAANSYRTRQVEQQQAELNIRSAARLVADELTAQAGSELQLTIVDVTQEVGGVKDHSIIMQLPEGTNLTAMQQLVVETAVWQYVRQNSLDTGNITLTNFPVSSMSKFWYQYTSGDVTGTVTLKSPVDDSATPAYFISKNGTGLYSFYVTLGDENQLSVSMNAFYQSKEVTSEMTTQDGKVTTTSTQTVILWGEPTVEKGG